MEQDFYFDTTSIHARMAAEWAVSATCRSRHISIHNRIDTIGFTLEQAGLDLAVHAPPSIRFEDSPPMLRKAAGDLLHDILTHQCAVGK